MSKFKTKKQLLDEITKERQLLEALLQDIPDEDKSIPIVDEMSIKDFLAHRMEWGRMMERWYLEARAGNEPAVPTDEYKWNQLKELNAQILEKHKDVPLREIFVEFEDVHDELYMLVDSMTEEELFNKKYYGFTGVSDLATYVNSATASHYRSMRRQIQKWWKTQAVT